MNEVLSLEELEILIKAVTEKIEHNIIHHNRQGQLQNYISLLPIDIELGSNLINEKEGKILVVGQSNVRKNVLRAIGSNLDIDVKRFELVINYEEVKSFSFKKLAYSNQYDYILVGPMPHKVKGLEDESSIIAQIENNPDIYPEIIRVMTQSGELKITKTSFRKALEENII